MEEQVEMTKEQPEDSYRLMSEDPEGKDRPCVFIEKGPFAGITVAYGKFQMAMKKTKMVLQNVVLSMI